MKWNNLKDGKCPSCSRMLTQEGSRLSCPGCSFKISEARCSEIIRFGYKPVENTVDEEDKRLQELNLLGRKPFNPYSY